MHELSIATNLLQLIVEQQKEHQFNRVSRIHLVIGEFSTVVPEALEFSFEIVSQGTVAEGAEIVIRTLPLVLKCHACGSEFETEPYMFVCPQCGSTEVEIVSGNELNIESIEV